MAHHHGPVGVAEDDLGTHVDEFVNEEQAALEHFLVEEHRTAGLRGHHEQHRQQVGSEPRPRCVTQSHDGTVDK